MNTDRQAIGITSIFGLRLIATVMIPCEMVPSTARRSPRFGPPAPGRNMITIPPSATTLAAKVSFEGRSPIHAQAIAAETNGSAAKIVNAFAMLVSWMEAVNRITVAVGKIDSTTPGQPIDLKSRIAP